MQVRRVLVTSAARMPIVMPVMLQKPQNHAESMRGAAAKSYQHFSSVMIKKLGGEKASTEMGRGEMTMGK